MAAEGWAWHDPAKVWHYYVKRASLCRRFVWHGSQGELQPHDSNLGLTGARFVGHCAPCYAKAEKRNVRPESLPLFRGRA